MNVRLLRFHPASGRDDDAPERKNSFGPFMVENEDLPYKIELWSESRDSVEQVLATTLSPALGYAAYYAATREYPGRYVTLRHKNRIVSRWNGPPQ